MSSQSPSRGHLVAVQTLKVTICDRCGTADPTRRYMLGFPEGKRRTFDLCATCSAPLDEFLDLIEVVGDRGPKQFQQPVLTEREVEAKRASKKPAKRPARKKAV